MAKTKTKKVKNVKCLCIRKCFLKTNPKKEKSWKLFHPDETWYWPGNAIPRHFVKFTMHKGTAIEYFQEQLSEYGVEFDEMWDLERLERELKQAKIDFEEDQEEG